MERASGARSPWPGSRLCPSASRGIWLLEAREVPFCSSLPRGKGLKWVPPYPKHLQFELWCRAPVEEGGLVLGLRAGKEVSPPASSPQDGHRCQEVRQTDGWMGSTVWLRAQRQVSLPPVSEACFPLPSLSCLISQEVLGESAPHVPTVMSPAPGRNVPAVKQ